MKRPKDMTEEELRGLPERDYEMVEQRVGDARVMVPVGRAVMCSLMGEDDLVWARIDDESWTFGQYADGTWFRERA